jgi:hypothetical protein
MQRSPAANAKAAAPSGEFQFSLPKVTDAPSPPNPTVAALAAAVVRAARAAPAVTDPTG